MNQSPNNYREKAIEVLRQKLVELPDRGYVLSDYIVDDCLRSILGIESKGIGKPPYEDYLACHSMS